MMGNFKFIPAKPPSKEDLRLKSPEERNLIREDISFRIITPVFGGGVRTEDNQHPIDGVTPIRTASIRGQLRFWWRALAECSSIEDLRTKEGKLWGKALEHGKISIALVKTNRPIREIPVFGGREGKKPLPGFYPLAYGAFPLQGTEERPEPKKLSKFSEKDTFILRVEFPENFYSEVEATIFAWLHFGGIGGRTRRGFGAIAPVEDKWKKNPADLIRDFRKKGPNLPGVTSFRGAKFKVTSVPGNSGIEALQHVLKKLKGFRQWRENGKTPWPEPNAIKAQRKGRRAPLHKFPRAIFGMPIIFHFINQRNLPDQTLNPRGKERRASPLFLRPFLDHNGKFKALALVLMDPAIRKEIVQLNNHNVEIFLTREEAKKIKPLEGNPDVLGKFLEYFESGS